MYRGVFPVHFDTKTADARALYQDVFDLMIEKKIVKAGDRIIFTKGDLDGVSGSTNAMKIVEVTARA
jgi:pyruvate kinase